MKAPLHSLIYVCGWSSRWPTSSLVASVVLGVLCLVAAPQSQGRTGPIPHGPFYVQSYTGKCLTYGGRIQTSPDDPPPPLTPAIFTDDCPSSSGPLQADLLPQRIIVDEINVRHDVILRAAGEKVIGVMGNVLSTGVRLELQDLTYASGQIWAFDGDSLMLAADRSLVAEVQGGRTPRATPIVLGSREVEDAEFWTLVPVSGGHVKPTNGFVRVPEEKTFSAAIAEASWGTVIEVHPDLVINVDTDAAPNLPDSFRPAGGVTIRGGRRGIRGGALVRLNSYPEIRGLFDITGNSVRITGLRVRGPSRSTDVTEDSSGIYVERDELAAVIDHNEISDWTHAAVQVKTFDDYFHGDDDTPGEDDACGDWTIARSRTVLVTKNFLHHNAKDGLGYGVTLHANGSANITGNTFSYNRHAIAADGIRHTGYRAFYNLVLSVAPKYGYLGRAEHDFDMHGSDPSGHHTGGIAGSEVDIAWNTFLGANRLNYDLRGIPCAPHRFHNNVSRQDKEDAIRWYELAGYPPAGVQHTPDWPAPFWLQISNNRFDIDQPMAQLRVGDFDGDGLPDLFVATGTSWYYSPRGKMEWRYLNRQTTLAPSLLFGDFDGDGRTDVVSKQGTVWYVSWAGKSSRERLNEGGGAISDHIVGDFDGDGRADLLHANGLQWSVAYGGVGPFVTYALTNHRIADLRFGDFNGDRRTDAFAVMNGFWMVRAGGSSLWTPLRSALTSSVANLVIADFNGNGRSDVAMSSGSAWNVSIDGVGNWTTLRQSDIALTAVAAIGPFDTIPGDDILDWNRSLDVFNPDEWMTFLEISSAGWVPLVRHSRDYMR